MSDEDPTSLRRASPTQDRGARTVDQILAAAAELLAEVGFERMSTNQVCRRAGLSPPALYRYFRNKYAVLAALGERLMEAQNRFLFEWTQTADLGDPHGAFRSLLEGTVEATRGFPSGVWVLRALRATPVLAEVRLASHSQVTEGLADWLETQLPQMDREDVQPKLRVAVDLAYAAVEMCFDETGVDEATIVDQTALVLTAQLAALVAGGPAPCAR